MAWVPRSGFDSLDDVVWLPRLFDKARRVADLGGGSRLIDGYCYGNNDFMDAKVLCFLKTDDDTVSSILEERSDDETARILVERSGRSPEECRKFSEDFKRGLASFPVLDADEGKLAPGIKTAALRFFYNRVMMPIVYTVFRRAEAKRSS